MERKIKKDPYFDKQPPLLFKELLLKPFHQSKPEYFGKRSLKTGEVNVNGLYIKKKFAEDPDGLLDTVYKDFDLFLKVYEIGGSSFPIYIEKGETPCFEAYKVEVSVDRITITAADTEGVRRAVIYLEDELRYSEGAQLCTGITERKPVIKARVTRCFFAPTNRPPKNGDELSDDVDYYPEEYLNRLMHDGTNGVWIYTRFADLLPSSVFEENGVGGEKRIEKLNRVIAKCERYGIKVYVFAIEPEGFSPEKVLKYPELVGTIARDEVTGETIDSSLCVATELGRKYCVESGELLMKLAPKLGGFIGITQGERTSSCSSMYKRCNCVRCEKRKQGEVLAEAVGALRSGFRAGNPKSETVSWTYDFRVWDTNDIWDYVDNVPDDVTLMQNFEDMGYEKQLGKTRLCVDYWLSYVGPSALFETVAQRAKQKKKKMWAKMQVCCSHEIASVPYIPVPGILYEKYRKAIELGVEGVMQCWYFGNYPSLMSKAAGELAFMGQDEDENAFLERLAGIYWGQSKAKAAVSAWKAFEDGYKNYPMNIMFSYYGPMHNSVVWKLALKPKNFSLPRTWQTYDPDDGDRIGECILNGHTIDEVELLLNNMYAGWKKGMEILRDLPTESEDEREQKSLAEVLETLISSSRNIIEFYKLREQLGLKIGDSGKTLSKMKAIVYNEIENSERCISICEKDSRLGYHSEGEGYKFFPEKLRDRIESLKALLTDEFPEVEKRIDDGLTPLAYYDGEEQNDCIKSYSLQKCELKDAKWEPIGSENDRKFRVSYDNDCLYLEMQSKSLDKISIYPEFRLLWPDACIDIDTSGKASLEYHVLLYYPFFDQNTEKIEKELGKYDITMVEDNDNKTHIQIKIKRADVNLEMMRPFKFKFVMEGVSWCEEENPISVLGKFGVSPGEYGWILP